MRLSILLILSLTLTSFAQAASAPVPVHIVLPNDIDGDSAPTRVALAQCVSDVAGYISDPNGQYARHLCSLREEHAKAKSNFVAKLQKLVDDYADYTNHGVNLIVANAALKTVDMAIACMSAYNIEDTCHNISCLTIPEKTRLDCYNWALTNPAVVAFSKGDH